MAVVRVRGMRVVVCGGVVVVRMGMRFNDRAIVVMPVMVVVSV